MNRETRREKQASRQSSRQAGQILVESIVGISVALMGLLGVLTLLTRSYAYTQSAGQRFVATYLAAEGIEVVRSMVDKNYVDNQPWNRGISPEVPYAVNFDSQNLTPVSGTADPLLYDPATGIYRSDIYGTSEGATPFHRIVEISYPEENLNEMIVISRVSWTTKGENNEVVLEDHFFDWRISP